jgi:hypothetical protein
MSASDIEPKKTQVTPVELAALFMEAACQTSDEERKALAGLAEFLGVDLGQVLAELMFLRTYAVDLAVAMTLGHSPARQVLLEQFYGHWERISEEAGFVLSGDLQAHLGYYTEAVGDETSGGLGDRVGQAFAARFGGEGATEMALLGGRMFGAFYEEIAQTLGLVEIVLYEEEE